LQDELAERLSLSDEKCKEAAEQLERIKQVVRGKEVALASLQNKYDEESNEALNRIDMLKEREKSLSEANQAFAETICEMELEKVLLQSRACAFFILSAYLVITAAVTISI